METKEKERLRVGSELADHYNSYKHVFKPGDKVLDVGMGTGNTARHLKLNLPDLSIQGLDLIDIRNTPDVPLTLYRGSVFPFEANVFDVVLLFYALHHIKWPLLTLGEAARVTKRTVIVIEEFALPDLDEEVDENQERQTLLALGIPLNLEHVYLGEEELESFFQAAGLKIIDKTELKSKTRRKIKKVLYILNPLAF